MKYDLISVIVPLYNVEKYIPDMMKMLLGQTYPNLEIILVDDGSEDNSYKICKEFEIKYRSIHVYRKKNGGAASARNYGVEKSTGNYIVFVDSDDWIAEDYVEFLFQILKRYNADISMCGLKKFFGSQIKPMEEANTHIELFSAEKALEDLLYRRRINNSPCAKLMKKELFLKTPFPEGMLFEDLAVVYQWIGNSNTIAYSSNVKYYYLQREGSSMHSAFDLKKWDRIRITLKMKEYIEDKFPSLCMAVDSRMMITTLQMLRELPMSQEYLEQRKMLKYLLKSTRKKVLLDKQNSVSTRILALSAFLPYVLLKYMGMSAEYLVMKFKIVKRY